MRTQTILDLRQEFKSFFCGKANRIGVQAQG
jgi:hypothetical protein